MQALHKSAAGLSRPSLVHTPASAKHTQAPSAVQQPAQQPDRLTRRDFGLQLALTTGLSLLPTGFSPAPASAGELITYQAAKDKTPALRSGVIKADTRYSFSIPASAKEQRIVGVMTGNFCMPNCAEPWLEAVFEDSDAGKVQLLAIPLVKLTNTKDAKIAQVGSPDNLLQRIGSYLTGSYFDEDSLVAMETKTKDDGLQYYEYELNQLDATNGPHVLSQVTSKGEVLYMFVTSATDKQWKKSEGVLRQCVDSFVA